MRLSCEYGDFTDVTGKARRTAALGSGACSVWRLSRSIDAFERRGFALLNGTARLVIGRAEQLGGEALIADLQRRVGPHAGSRNAAGRSLQDRICLLAGLAGTGGIDDLARLLGGGDFLRPRRPQLRRSQVEIGRDRQRRPRFDRELVGTDLLHADGAAQAGAARQQHGQCQTKNREEREPTPCNSGPITADHGERSSLPFACDEARRNSKPSSNIATTPRQMALSARLNAGQYHEPA